jgi:hypothetical protein
MSNWKEKFSFLTPPSIEHAVGGQTLKFYPMSVKVTFQLQSLATPLLESLTVLFSKPESDAASAADYNKDGSLKNVRNEAVAADIAQLRTEQRQAAMKKAINTLLDPSNSEVAGSLIADALRDDLPRDMSMADKVAFVDSLTAANLGEMLIGVFKANKEVFAPLLRDLVGPMEKGLAAVGLSNPLAPESESSQG